MSVGKGSVQNQSTKQRLNTRSSTETEVVAVHDAAPNVIWTNHFLEAQGHSLDNTSVHQDNESAVLLEKNGKASSSKRTKHINMRYFFIADRQASNELTILWCSTNDMVADFFTKPLQGAKFRHFRKLIMNLKCDD